jgi:PAS domain-containing protein
MPVFDEAADRQMGSFLGAGEMHSLIYGRDWTNTALGALETWPQSLRTAVDIMLRSRSPMFVWWGREFLNLYNDAYRPFLGQKHPAALGRSARDVWTEIWDFVGPRGAAVEEGRSTFDEAMLLIMERHGYPEATYFTFSYSPIYDDRGAVGGIFGVVTDETSRIVGERRLKLLRDVSVRIAQTNEPEQICEVAASCISDDAQDLPFALIYLMEGDGSEARLVARAGIAAEHPVAAQSIDLEDTDSIWPLGRAKNLNDPVLVKDLQARFKSLPMGAWDRPPSHALVLPLSDQRHSGPSGFLVAGLSPYLHSDDDYGGFLGLLAGQIAGGITNARIHERERTHAEARHLAVVAANELRVAAQLAQDRAEVILASISDGFLAVDAEWRFTYVNAAAEEVMGRSASDVIGRNYWTEYPPDVDIEREINLRHAMEKRVSVAYESYFHQLNIWLDVRV